MAVEGGTKNMPLSFKANLSQSVWFVSSFQYWFFWTRLTYQVWEHLPAVAADQNVRATWKRKKGRIRIEDQFAISNKHLLFKCERSIWNVERMKINKTNCSPSASERSAAIFKSSGKLLELAIYFLSSSTQAAYWRSQLCKDTSAPRWLAFEYKQVNTSPF